MTINAVMHTAAVDEWQLIAHKLHIKLSHACMSPVGHEPVALLISCAHQLYLQALLCCLPAVPLACRFCLSALPIGFASGLCTWGYL